MDRQIIFFDDAMHFAAYIILGLIQCTSKTPKLCHFKFCFICFLIIIHTKLGFKLCKVIIMSRFRLFYVKPEYFTEYLTEYLTDTSTR